MNRAYCLSFSGSLLYSRASSAHVTSSSGDIPKSVSYTHLRAHETGSLPPPMLSHNATGSVSEQGILPLIFWQFIIQRGLFSTCHLLLWQHSKIFAFWPVSDHFQNSWATGVSYASSLCVQRDSRTPRGISCMICRGDPPFEDPAQHCQLGC